MFEEAGVEADWANWGEFIADMKTLQDTLGVEALGVPSRPATDWSIPGAGWTAFFSAPSGPTMNSEILHGQIQLTAVFWPGCGRDSASYNGGGMNGEARSPKR